MAMKLDIDNKAILRNIEKEIEVLESQSSSLKSLIEHLRVRFEQLSYSLSSTKMHLDGLSAEMTRIQEINRSWKDYLNRDLCLDVARIKNPNTTLVRCSEIFLIIFDVSEPTWKKFKAAASDYLNFIREIEEFDINRLTREKIDVGVEILKNFHEIIGKIKKYPRGVRVLTEVLRGFIEHKIKKNVFEESLQEYL